jgi:hypothetical protein
MVDYIVSELALSARRDPSTWVDLPIRDVDFLAHLARLPSHILDGGGDIAGADLLFGQVFFVHGYPSLPGIPFSPQRTSSLYHIAAKRQNPTPHPQ